MTTRPSADLTAERERLKERRAAVARAHADRDRDLHDAREVLARAVAHGAAEPELTTARDRARELSEEVEGLSRAIPLLEAEIEALAVELGKAESTEAAAVAAELVATGKAAVNALVGALDVFLEEWLPLANRTEAATAAAWRAEVRAAELAGKPTPPASATVSSWPQTFPVLLRVAREYRGIEQRGDEAIPVPVATRDKWARYT